MMRCLATACLLGLVGCGQLAYRLNNSLPEDFIPNPVALPAADDDFVWSQVVDTVDDYFDIVREQPLQVSAEVMMDGRCETAYRIGGSIFEPWRKDSTAGFERLQSTLQSIRRRAIVNVRPQITPAMVDDYGPAGMGATFGDTSTAGSINGYTIEVVVQKDLEDTDRTQFATESATSARHDGTIVRQGDSIGDNPQTLGWISLGRDTSLEQRLLRDIFGRVTQPDRAH